jgi:Apea-like HEPN
MSNDKKTDKALRRVKHLIESLRAGAGQPDAVPSGRGGMFVFDRRLGALRLTGAKAQHYGRCLEGLIALQGGNPTVRATSYSAVEELLKKTILRSLRPNRPPGEPRARFKRRLDRETSALRKQLSAAPKEWRLSVPAYDIERTMLPMTFGGVEFAEGTEAAELVTAPIVNFRPHPRRAAKKVKEEQGYIRQDRRKMITIFERQPIATVRVFATDVDAARRLGLERIRKAVDILTFFAGFFTQMKHRFRAFVAPEGQRQDLHSLVSEVGTGRCNWGRSSPKARPLSGININSSRSTEIGFPMVDEMLSKEKPSDLETRLLTAMSWAGRAHAQHRRDQAFMIFAVALESLLTKPSARSGVTDRLCRRVAHIISTSPEAGKAIFGDAQSLYRIRSILVHTGESAGLTDEDLDTIEELVDRTVTVVLTGEPFTTMKTSAEFEQWLDDQSLKEKNTAAPASGVVTASSASP